MDNRRTQRLLLLAFAISLIVHATLAFGLRWPFPIPTEETPAYVHIDKVPRVLHIARAPTPLPRTPRPAPTAVASAVPSAPPHRNRGNSGAAGSPGSTLAPAAAAPPTIVPSAIPSAQTGTPCSKNDIPASVATLPSPPDIAPDVRAESTNATIRVRVRLDEHGTVLDAAVAQGSGNASLDLVALSLAKSAQYNPALHLCKPAPAEYTFTTHFAPLSP